MSLSKDWLVNFFGKTSRISAVHYRLQVWSALKFSNTDHILFHGKVTIQFLHQLRSHSNQARLKSGKAKSTSQFWTLCLARSRLYLSFVGLWKNTARLRWSGAGMFVIIFVQGITHFLLGKTSWISASQFLSS